MSHRPSSSGTRGISAEAAAAESAAANFGEAPDERILDLEVRIAYQDRLVRELDALVRQFADRLDAAERELKTLKQSLVSPESGIGPGNEPPPHY